MYSILQGDLCYGKECNREGKQEVSAVGLGSGKGTIWNKVVRESAKEKVTLKQRNEEIREWATATSGGGRSQA